VTTPEIIDQIHKLIFEDGWISAKSIAEQLDISRVRVGSIIHEDLDMRKLSAKWIPKCLNADHKLQLCHSSKQICNFFGANKIISCRTRLVSMGETWIYHYDPETKQQSKEWRHSNSPRPAPKKSEWKFRWKISGLDFFVIKSASSSLIIFQRATLSTRSIIHLSWSKWRTFCRKNLAGSSPRVSCSCTTIPRFTGLLEPRRNWPTWVSSILIGHHILRIWPRRTTTCSLDWKTIEISSFLSEAEVIPAAETWLARKKSEFVVSGLQKLEQCAKKCIEFRGEYVE